MARRPVFVSKAVGRELVSPVSVEFQWYAGLSKSQKQKSIKSLHGAAQRRLGIERILEISSKSEYRLGVALSAFNLMLTTPSGVRASVEVLFQGSKVFAGGGPYVDIYGETSVAAKRDARLRDSGELIGFKYFECVWPIMPKTAFYDWLYISALVENPDLSLFVLEFDAFTDIEFNPERSINCQASAAALYRALNDRALMEVAMASPSSFIAVNAGARAAQPSQTTLFE